MIVLHRASLEFLPALLLLSRHLKMDFLLVLARACSCTAVFRLCLDLVCSFQSVIELLWTSLPSFVTTITQEDQVLNYYLQASEVHEAGHQQTAVPKLILLS